MVSSSFQVKCVYNLIIRHKNFKNYEKKIKTPKFRGIPRKECSH